MPTIQTKIRRAIEARVASLSMAAQYTIVWTDGPGYTPDPQKAYLRATWTPNDTQRQFIGSRDPHRRPGVLQIDVFEVRTQGSAKAIETAGQVAEHFETDLHMAFMDIQVRVLKAPSVMAPFIDTHIQVPVLIEVEAYG